MFALLLMRFIIVNIELENEVINVNEISYFRPTQAIIDLSAIRKNIEGLRQHLHSNVDIIAVVKANGYGHGDVEVSKAALQAGATTLAVATPEEALHIREVLHEVPILILGAVPLEFVPYAAKYHITLTVFSAEWVEEVNKTYKNLSNTVLVHLKIDSGMGRIGVRTELELRTLVNTLEKSEIFKIDGVFTHFATADEENENYYKEQKLIFTKLIATLPTKPRLVHAANTAASLVKENVQFDAVRFGISMYGLSSSPFVEQNLSYKLTPAMTLSTELVHVKKIQRGESVGYGAAYTAVEEEEWIGTLPIGYADGLRRGLSGQEVLIEGQRVKIVGRVCMDQTMVKLPKKMMVGEEVVLIGKQKNKEIPMQEWADKLQTIVYEIPCMLTPRIARVYRP